MSVNERPLAEMLAREVLRDPVTHGWLAPLAREYLKEIKRFHPAHLVVQGSGEIKSEPASQRPGSLTYVKTDE